MKRDATTSETELLEVQRQRLWEGVEAGIRREVERRRREGLPIIVQLNGEIVDLQEVERNQRENPQAPPDEH